MSDLGHFPGPPPAVDSEETAASLRRVLEAVERCLDELGPDHRLSPDLGADVVRIRAALDAWDAKHGA
jgi:hypothetical protein